MDIFRGSKKYITRQQSQKAYCPQIPGLHLKDLLSFIESRPGLYEYLPAREEIPKLGKDWIAGMLQTLCTEEFITYIREQERAQGRPRLGRS